MSEKSYRPWAPEQSYLLPPSPRDWLPEGHLVYFLLDVIGELDISRIESKIQSKDSRGVRPYSPRMMLGLLLYGYCVGLQSSRKIERASYEDVAFRVLAGGQHPDHSRISAFRQAHLEAFKDLFVQVLRLCQKAGLVKLGQVAIDGTKLQGNASKHKAMSYQRMQETQRRLRREIDDLLKQAEQVDQAEDARFGVGQQEQDLPAELHRRQERLAKIRAAKAALEGEAAQSRAAALREQAKRALQTAADPSRDDRTRKIQGTKAQLKEEKARSLHDDDDPGPPGTLERHRVKTTTAGTPAPKAQRNFTDPESRIMERGGVFLQGYNCQAAVDESHQIVLAADVTNKCPDNANLVPMLEQVIENVGMAPAVLTADSGYWTPEAPEKCRQRGTDAYIATKRKRHGTVSGTPETTSTQTPHEAMQAKLETESGRGLYARRKCIVEPVFGQMKESRGVRRFLLRGLTSVQAEWQLICLTHNLLKVFRNPTALIPA